MRYLSLIVLLFYGCNPPAPTSEEVMFTFTNPNPVCGAIITSPCSKYDTLVDTTTNTIISTMIPAQATTYELTTLPSAGSHIYQLTITGVDKEGNPIKSNPVSTTVVIP